MATPLSLTHYRRNTIYADDVPQGVMFRSYHDEMYTDVIAQFPDDPVGHRRLVHRDFTAIRGIFTCVEHTVARVAANGLLSDWSLDVTLFRTHTVPPVRWNENNIPPTVHFDDDDLFDQTSSAALFAETEEDRVVRENMERMHRVQDELSRLP